MTDRLRMMYKAAHKLEQKYGRPPTQEELCLEMGVGHDKLRWMIEVARIPVSLESPVGDEDDTELGMFVEDTITPSPSQTTYENMLRETGRPGAFHAFTPRSPNFAPALWTGKWSPLHAGGSGA